jgi:DNA processing protein
MTDDDSTTRHLVALSHVPGIGPKRFGALMHRFGSPERAWKAPASDLRAVLDQKTLEAFILTRHEVDPTAALTQVTDAGAIVIARDDPDYPARLRQIPNPPFVLYVRGDPGLLSARAVAVVGTRRATDDGYGAAQKITFGLADAGLVIVSGLAGGIDTIAHRAALAAGAGTVAVLGCGIDTVYPAANHALQEIIARRGAVASEYPPGIPPKPGNFPARNRIVSGLSLATVVVEAGERSGALITARCALDQGRDVFAVPGSILSKTAVGANALLAAGAGVATSADEILTALDLVHLEAPLHACREPHVEPTEAHVLARLGAVPEHIDAIGRAADMAPSEVSRVLSMLEIKGLVHHTGGMRWTKTR